MSISLICPSTMVVLIEILIIPLEQRGRTSMQEQALYVRFARQTARMLECPGCFASLRSVQGAAPLAPLCGYPCVLCDWRNLLTQTDHSQSFEYVPNDRLKTWSSLSSGYTNTRIGTSLPHMPYGNLSREFILKLPTKAAANSGRTSAFPMTLWALSH